MKRGRGGKTTPDIGRAKPAAAEPAPAPPAPRALSPAPHPADPSGPARRLWPAALVIILAALVIYVPALRCGFIWDDDDYVTKNMTLRSLGGLAQIWFKLGVTPQYYPLVFTTFWAEFHLWGLSPFGYHLVNVLLHAGSALLLWTALRRLRVPGAFLAALLFAVHPVAVESVAWVTERKNVLSTFLYLLSFLAMIRFYGIDYDYDYDYELRARKRMSWRYFGLGLALFLGALLSKTVTCTLPGALVIVLWWKREKIKPRELFPLIPFFVLGAAMGLLTAWMEKHVVGAQGMDFTLSPVGRVLLAGRAIWFYLAKLALPFNLTFIYPRWTIDPGAWWQYLFPLGVAAAALALWLARRRIGRGPLAALAFFAASLFPALGFIDVYPMRYSFVADHFQYLAMLGPLALAGALLSRALGRLSPARLPLGRAALAALAVLLGAITWSLGPNYKDFETVWRANIARNPRSAIAFNNLGLVLNNRGDYAQAAANFERALAANPRFVEAHINLASCLTALDRTDEALAHDAEIQRLAPTESRSWFNIGNIMIKRGKWEEALAAFEKALALNPGLIELHFRGCKPAAAPAINKLGLTLIEKGDHERAQAYFERALAVNPAYAEAHFNLANCLAEREKNDEALAHYAEAQRLDPADERPSFNIGNLMLRLGRKDEAAAAFQKALAINPNLPDACFNLATMLAERRQFAEALALYQRARQLAPGDANAAERLAWLLAAAPDGKLRDGAAAVALAEAACRAAGDNPQCLDTLAMAYAEAGRFDEAVAAAQKAAALARAAGNEPQAAAIAARLKLYQSRHPYHE